MNRFVAITIGALPIVALSLLPKPAAAQAIPPSLLSNAPFVVADRDDDANQRRDDWRNNADQRRDDWRNNANQRRDDWRNNADQRRDDWRDNDQRRNDTNRRDNDWRDSNRRDNQRRVWIPGHWERGFLGIGRKWVAGHYERR